MRRFILSLIIMNIIFIYSNISIASEEKSASETQRSEIMTKISETVEKGIESMKKETALGEGGALDIASCLDIDFSAGILIPDIQAIKDAMIAMMCDAADTVFSMGENLVLDGIDDMTERAFDTINAKQPIVTIDNYSPIPNTGRLKGTSNYLLGELR